jgi:hypothetical protein
MKGCRLVGSSELNGPVRDWFSAGRLGWHSQSPDFDVETRSLVTERAANPSLRPSYEDQVAPGASDTAEVASERFRKFNLVPLTWWAGTSADLNKEKPRTSDH